MWSNQIVLLYPTSTITIWILFFSLSFRLTLTPYASKEPGRPASISDWHPMPSWRVVFCMPCVLFIRMMTVKRVEIWCCTRTTPIEPGKSLSTFPSPTPTSMCPLWTTTQGTINFMSGITTMLCATPWSSGHRIPLLVSDRERARSAGGRG